MNEMQTLAQILDGMDKAEKGMTRPEWMMRVLLQARVEGVPLIEDNCERTPEEVRDELDMPNIPFRHESGGHADILHDDDSTVHRTYATGLSLGKDCTSQGVPWVDFNGRLAVESDSKCGKCYGKTAKGE